MSWTNLRIKSKLYAAFALVLLLFIAGGGLVYSLKQETGRLSTSTLDLYAPTSFGVITLKGDLYKSANALRGYLLLGSEQQVGIWQSAWEEIAGLRADLDKYMDRSDTRWKSTDHFVTWETLKSQLDAFKAAQEKVIALKKNGEAEAAINSLQNEVVPLLKAAEKSINGDKAAGEGGLQEDLHADMTEAGQETQADLQEVGNTLLAVIVLASLFSVFIAVVVGRSIAIPLQGLIAVMARMSKGELELVMPSTDRKDESGDVAQALEGFRQSLVAAEKARLERETAERRAAEAQARKVKLTEEFVAATMQIVQALTAAATELQSASQTLTATADRTAQQASSVSAASEEATRNVQAVASAGEELSSSIAEISRQVSTSSKIAGKAADEAQTTNTRIQGLARAADRIGEVLKLITDIAEQTNLLALNATIEAARAGDAGKGFAVVAAEVKNLANQTAKATEEIGAKIFEMQSATAESVSAIKSINGTIGEINEIAGAIAAAVEEQGAATSEISRNVREAATGTSEVSNNVVEVSQAAGETGSAASQVQGAASELSVLAERMRKQTNDFVTTLNAI